MFCPQEFLSVWQVLRRGTEKFYNTIYNLQYEMQHNVYTIHLFHNMAAYIASRMKKNLPSISIATSLFSLLSIIIGLWIVLSLLHRWHIYMSLSSDYTSLSAS